MNQKILFIARTFPPAAGPAVHRTLNFVKQLQCFGFTPVVLTVADHDIDEHTPIDRSLLDEIPENIEIIKTRSGEFRKIKNILLRIRLYRLVWFFLYPFFWESTALWPFYSYSKAKNCINKHGIKYIYTTSSPFSSLLLGVFLKLTVRDLIWVADIRDPLTDGYMWMWPSKTHWYLSRIMERIMFKFPDHIIVTSPALRRLYINRKLVNDKRISTITNGFN